MATQCVSNVDLASLDVFVSGLLMPLLRDRTKLPHSALVTSALALDRHLLLNHVEVILLWVHLVVVVVLVVSEPSTAS